MSNDTNKEIEVRFLEIDPPALKSRLVELGAIDHGEDVLEEIIFYGDKFSSSEFIRLRRKGGKTTMTYKNHRSQQIGDVEEIETEVESILHAAAILEKTGLTAFRRQQKKRHTFKYKNVVVDIDTWPKIPPYVELEGPSEEALREVAKDLGFTWEAVEMRDAMKVIESYGYKVKEMRWFTFDRME